MIFIQTALLLLLIVALGAWSRYKDIFAQKDTVVLSTFVYNFAFPALLIATLAKLNFDIIEFEIVVGSILPIVIILAVIVLLYKRQIISKEQMILAGVTIGFGSNAFFGIAYFDSMYGDAGLEFAVITAAILGIFGVVVCISLLEYAKAGKIQPKVFKGVLLSPPVLAVGLGVVLAIFDLDIGFLEKASALLGKTAGGVSIFVLGMFIYDHFSLAVVKKALPYALFRALALPLGTFLVLAFMDNISDELFMFLFQQAGIPAAISISIFANKYRYLQSTFAGIVMLSSFLSFAVLGVLYLLTSL